MRIAPVAHRFPAAASACPIAVSAGPLLRAAAGIVLLLPLPIAHAAEPAANAPTPPTLGYVESSTGLTPPGLDGGITEVEFADVDGDGNVDIVSIGDHGNPGIGTSQSGLMVWFGDGAGGWTEAQSGNFGYGGVAVGDANGDGIPDVAYGMHHNYSSSDFGDQLIEVALGDGSGTAWTPWDDGLATGGETYGMAGTDLADIDDDGDLDLASISFGCCNGLHVYHNNSDGTWSHTFASSGGNSQSNAIVFGDVNRDGVPDLATGIQNGTVWLGDGTGAFTAGDGNLPSAGSFGLGGPDLGDVNRDGLQDLSFANGAGGVEVWLAGTGGVWTKASNGLPASGPWDITQLEDMNGDGSLDLAAFGGATVTVWLGNGGGGWLQVASFSTPTPGGAEAFRVGGDVDHNGRPDIVLVSDEGGGLNSKNHLRVFLESTPATALTIRGTFPRGGEVLAEGSQRFVEWATAVPAGQTATVKLELSTTGPTGPWSLIADTLPDNGRYQWRVAPGVTTTNAYIRYTATAATSVTATTMAAFTIGVVDSDSDGFANSHDCALADPGVGAAPGEVASLLLSPDPAAPASDVIASWSSQSASAGPATVYDIITGPVGDLPGGVLDLAACSGNDAADAPASLSLPVTPGQARYVLVRGQNSCGTGGWGTASDGTPRAATVCP